ncbi:MAG TPA: 1-deoxy-D-xylulose-5-phosphate reductoisomerase [Lentisphaeria bacterium]|nr:MAG: 1-deoxy-D-xylulose-5-phosphate reductoisomerase [Lentisphaerae bacterium GWF2_38_69]HBM16535.1 1-deoxy-D-xylulose-5-phosphate reductoisomerase [Lentisphaeria bacterium]
MKNIVLLGSTGSIGTNAIRVIENHPDKLRLLAVAANNNIEVLAEQVKKFGCKFAVCNKNSAEKLKQLVPSSVKILCGIEGMIEISTLKEVDIVLCSVVGTAGLMPVLEAIKAKKDIALASKEVLVMAGDVVMPEVKKNCVRMLPVDSEHSAIFQCLDGRNHGDVSKIILTASGGAFRNHTKEEMFKASFADAMKHPTWNMGEKVTLDSATLMNKALEIIEAHHLFDMPPEKIDVIIHPQSIIHSMVEFNDGTILAQLGITDMKSPIQHALTYPEKADKLPFISLSKIGTLSFMEPDRVKYPSIDIAYNAIRAGGTMGAVMNAANEVAFEKFKAGCIPLPGIWDIIIKTMEKHSVITKPSLKEILSADKWARSEAEKITL